MSHDRYFLDTVVNDVAEIDRAYPGGLFRVEGRYSQFLEKKEEFLLGAVQPPGGAGESRAARSGVAAARGEGAHRQIESAHR